MKNSGVSATALYAAAGGNKPIEQRLQENGYDAVLISRPLNRDTKAKMKAGSAGAKAIRKDDGALKLFRYDYKELNKPVTWGVDISMTLLSELLTAKDNQKVWAVESEISTRDSFDDRIDEAAKKVVRQLERGNPVGK